MLLLLPLFPAFHPLPPCLILLSLPSSWGNLSQTTPLTPSYFAPSQIRFPVTGCLFLHEVWCIKSSNFVVYDFVPQTFQSVQHHPVDIDFLKKKEIALGMEGLWPNYPPIHLWGWLCRPHTWTSLYFRLIAAFRSLRFQTSLAACKKEKLFKNCFPTHLFHTHVCLRVKWQSRLG